MKTMALMLLALVCFAVEPLPTPVVDAPPLDADHAVFAAVLARCVRPDGVDYAALRAAPGDLDRYRAQLAAAPLPTARPEVLALFINAYNAHTLALVLATLPADQGAWPAWSITQATRGDLNPWQAFDMAVAGRRYTLDAIEHQVLRPLGDPRIHMAVNCASRSCPPLAAEPFRAATIDAQLEAVARDFANDPYHVRLAGAVVTVNPILDWFAADFASGGGVRAFLRARRAADTPGLAGDGPLPTFVYDWRLNLAGTP
jgi:hypothetical protein